MDVGLVQHGVLVFTDNDKGTFSPGTLIERQYGYGDNNGKGLALGDDMMQNRCIVLGVQYADGTSWKSRSRAVTTNRASGHFAFVMHDKIEGAGRDLHNLGPGSGNTARFGLGDDNVYHPQCIPLRVNYAEGTVWYNPLFAPQQTTAKN